MKKLTILSFCLLMCLHGYGQIPPNFIFPLKVTNALGHKDSVQIGSYINTSGISGSHFLSGLDGPNLIGTSADSNIDVRVALAVRHEYATNIRVIPSACSSNITSPFQHGNQVVIMIYTKKWPVRLSWDSTLFAQNYCVHKSFFSITKNSSAYPPSIDPESFYAPIRMAALHGSLKIDSASNWFTVDNNDLPRSILLNNTKQGNQFTVSLYLNHTLVSNVSTKEAKKYLSLSLYPNPAGQRLIINAPTSADNQANILNILTIEGKTVYTQHLVGTDKQYNIGIANLVSGLYFVQIRTKDGSIYRSKFVKQ